MVVVEARDGSPSPSRVVVLGISGGGKSTTAALLGQALGLPVFHLDATYWRAGRPGDPAELHAAVLSLIAQDRWVIDGNYLRSGALRERVERAEALVVVDAARFKALWRVTWRYLRQRLGGRSDHGNPARLSPGFVRWIWRWPRDHGHLIAWLVEQAPGTPLFVVRSRDDVDRLISDLRPD